MRKRSLAAIDDRTAQLDFIGRVSALEVLYLAGEYERVLRRANEITVLRWKTPTRNLLDATQIAIATLWELSEAATQKVAEIKVQQQDTSWIEHTPIRNSAEG